MSGVPGRDHVRAGDPVVQRLGVEITWHYGDPETEYVRATSDAAVRDRSHRARLLVKGRAPIGTLNGVLTGRMPRPPANLTERVVGGRAEYSAVLSPKGRVVADARVMWGAIPDGDNLWLDVPRPALKPLLNHLRRYVPPRLAVVEDISDEAGLLTLMGPRALTVFRELVPWAGGIGVEGLGEGDYVASDDGWERVLGTSEVATPAWDVFTSKERSRRLWDQLLDRGVAPVGASVWDTLRVEAGRPAFGQDMDESFILSEVGIVDRAVDHAKGCYTGQEVIVRIRDRGRVNRSLRGLRLGDSPAPGSDAELFHEGALVGRITSVVSSPRCGGTIALAYVRREIPPGGVVVVGSDDGPRATVHELVPGWAASPAPRPSAGRPGHRSGGPQPFH